MTFQHKLRNLITNAKQRPVYVHVIMKNKQFIERVEIVDVSDDGWFAVAGSGGAPEWLNMTAVASVVVVHPVAYDDDDDE